MNINYIFKYSFLLRILATPLLFFTKHSIPYTVLLLVLIGLVDCNPLILKVFPKEELEKHQYCTLNHEFIVIDKLIDIFQYCVAIYFLSPQLPKFVLHILMGFIISRLIGIFFHFKTKDTSHFVTFFDFIKEYLLLVYIYHPNLHLHIIIEAIVTKMTLEYAIHKERVFVKLFKQLL